MIGERVYSGSPYEEKAGYARAVVVDGWIFVSGTTGFDPDTKQFPEDVESQCENCFRNISRALAEAGATLDDLVRVLIFVTSLYGLFAYATFFLTLSLLIIQMTLASAFFISVVIALAVQGGSLWAIRHEASAQAEHCRDQR